MCITETKSRHPSVPLVAPEFVLGKQSWLMTILGFQWIYTQSENRLQSPEWLLIARRYLPEIAAGLKDGRIFWRQNVRYSIQ